MLAVSKGPKELHRKGTPELRKSLVLRKGTDPYRISVRFGYIISLAHNLSQNGFNPCDAFLAKSCTPRHSFHYVQSVPREGVEPSCREACDFESHVYTNSTTEAGAVRESVPGDCVIHNRVNPGVV